MWFAAIRFALGALVLIIGFLAVRKSRIVCKRRWSLAVFAGAVAVTTVSALIPFENAFVTFPSSEAAYHYMYSGDIRLIVEGRETDFVVGSKADTDIYIIVPKTDNGWKLGMGTDIKRVAQIMDGGLSIEVFGYKDSRDYYITVLDANGGAIEVADNRNSVFYASNRENTALGKTFSVYYACINDFDGQYVVTVNGKTISFRDKHSSDA